MKHSVNVITLKLAQSDPIKRRAFYYKHLQIQSDVTGFKLSFFYLEKLLDAIVNLGATRHEDETLLEAARKRANIL